MFKNYFTIAIRNLWKNKSYSFINIFGLAIAIVSCIFILLWVIDELSFDRFHENAEVIYRVIEHQGTSNGDYMDVAVTPWPLAEALNKDFPEIIETSRLRIVKYSLVSYQEKKFIEDNVVAVDPSFLKMFDFPLLEGDANTALNDPNSILVTENTANKYFNMENPIGKTININSIEYNIAGIIANTPTNSHINFDFLIPFVSLKTMGWTDSWGTNNYTTYVQLMNKSSYELIKEKVYNYFMEFVNPQSGCYLDLQPLTDIHLKSHYSIDLYGATEMKMMYIYGFSAAALFILFIACFNFINLSTALSEKRSKEMGLRKVVGAIRKQIIAQFYGESVLIVIISFFIALLIIFVFLNDFNNITGKLLKINTIFNPLVLIGIFSILFFTAILSATYPAIVQSAFKPVDSIKGGGMVFTSKPGKSIFRKILVVFQFVLSVILIIGALTITKQINFMLNKDLGYSDESIIYFRKRGELIQNYDAFKSELLKNTSIKSVTTSSDIPTYTVHSTSAFEWEGKNPEDGFMIHQFSIDHDFIKTFGITMLDGRDLSKEFPVDDSTQSFIINEATAKKMGVKNPIGLGFTLYDFKGQIVGLVKDFHYKSLQTEVEPLVMRIEPRRDRYIFVKLDPNHFQEAKDIIQTTYQRFNSEYPFEYNLLEDEVGELYKTEQKTKLLLKFFTVIAILMSCLGLYGLASYLAVQKTKEIGIRKVHGATVIKIVNKLTKEFIILVLLANVIAWPLAYIVMNEWLQNFVYRINLGATVFIIAGLISIILGIITVGYHTLTAATANPIKSLRYE